MYFVDKINRMYNSEMQVRISKQKQKNPDMLKNFLEKEYRKIGSILLYMTKFP